MKVDIIYDPGGNGFRIESIWAFLSIGVTDNDEGVISITTPMTGTIPLIAADERRLELLSPRAQEIATMGNRPVQLARFDRRTDLGLIVP